MKALLIRVGFASLLFFLLAADLLAQPVYPLFSPSAKSVAELAALRQGARLELEPAVLSRILNERPEELRLKLPRTNGPAWELALARRDVLTDGFQLADQAGKVLPYQAGHYCQGYVVGRPDAQVAAAFTATQVMIVILSPEGSYNIGPVGRYAQGNTDYIFFLDKDALRQPPAFPCQIIGAEGPVKGDGNDVMADQCRVVTKLFVCDFQMYLDFDRSTQAVMDYVSGMYNVVSMIYDREQIRTLIARTEVFTQIDPFRGGATSKDMIDDFKAYDALSRNDNQGISLAHLLSSQDLRRGGIARIEALCLPTSDRVAFSELNLQFDELPAYSWTILVVTHEMGHNLGSRHTHSCTWSGGAIDGCVNVEQDITSCSQPPRPRPPFQGTIMSYCHLVPGVGINPNLGFGPLPGERIRDRTRNARCLIEDDCNCHAPRVPIIANQPDPTSATLQWIAMPYATGYEIQYRKVGEPSWSQTVLTSQTQYLITGLEVGASYEIRVRTLCDNRARAELSNWSRIFLGEGGGGPIGSCGGQLTLIEPAGTFDDGSGPNDDYDDNLDCRWLIQPPGAEALRIVFEEFRTERLFDQVFVYDGPTEGSALLGRFSGTMLPDEIITSQGSALIVFQTDESSTESGWRLYYESTGSGVSPCSGLVSLTDPSGIIEDGSGPREYGDNLYCQWLIQPPGAEALRISFLDFQTEGGYDIVSVYDGPTQSDRLLGQFSGLNLPSELTTSQGQALVIFSTDASVTYPGWSLQYETTTGGSTNACSGLRELTEPAGTFSDGSGPADYDNNLDCRWLISPPAAQRLRITFESLQTEEGFDFVTIYDGPSASDRMLGTFTGARLPDAITTSQGQALVVFTTDASATEAGWTIRYETIDQSSENPCAGVRVLTEPSGTFDDGSDLNNYGDQLVCRWHIRPPGADRLQLSFENFRTEEGFDLVAVYDGPNADSPRLGLFSGTALPPVLTTTQGHALVVFTTDQSINFAGWRIRYEAEGVGRTNAAPVQALSLRPNPAAERATISLHLPAPDAGLLEAFDAAGRRVLSRSVEMGAGENLLEIDLAAWPAGVYALRLNAEKALYTGRLVKQ